MVHHNAVTGVPAEETPIGMQTFTKFMVELFDSHARLSWDYSSRSSVTATFTADDIRVTVSFEQRATDGPWYVMFEVDQGDRAATTLIHSSFKIFGGVFQAAEEFIGVREPETVVFATKQDGLAGIYQTYLRKESTMLEKLGYKLEDPQKVDPYVEFILKRIKPSGWRP